MWWRSEVNCSFFLCLAAFRTRSNAWVTRARLCVRCVLCWSAFPLVPGLGSANSAAGRPALFTGFIATMPESDFSGSASAASAPHLPATDHPATTAPMADPEISRFPRKERPYMPGSKTTPGLAGARTDAPASVAFRGVNNVGTRVYNAFAAQWLAYTPPYRRFAVILAEDCARIGGDVGCYSFIRRPHFRSDLPPPCLRFAVAVAGHHARLGTRLLVRLCRGRHRRRLNSMRLQGATPHRTGRGALSGSAAIAGFCPHRTHRAQLRLQPGWKRRRNRAASRRGRGGIAERHRQAQIS